MARSDRCYFFGCCSDRRSPQSNNNVELVELKLYIFQVKGFWEKAHNSYSGHKIPSHTLNCLFPRNTFLPRTNYFIKSPSQQKFSRRTGILKNGSIGWPCAIKRHKQSEVSWNMLVFTYSHNNNNEETICKIFGQRLSIALGKKSNIWGVVRASALSGFFQTECYGRFQNSHYQRKSLNKE